MISDHHSLTQRCSSYVVEPGKSGSPGSGFLSYLFPDEEIVMAC